MTGPFDPRKGEVRPELPDPALDGFLADVVDGVEYDIDRDGAVGDLPAVLSMAKQLDPNAVPPGWIEEASKLAPVVPLSRGRRMRQTRDDPELDAVVAQVRAAVDHEVAVGLHRSPPAPPPSASQERRGRSRRGMWIGWAAAAAVLLMATTALSGVLLERLQAQPVPDAALLEHGNERGTMPTEPRAVHPSKGDADREPAPEIEVHDEEVADSPDGADAAVPEPTPGAKRRRRARSHVDTAPEPVRAETLEQRLSRLDREAHRAWKAGDTTTARAKLEEIVRIGKKHRLADLAYGDLFTLARQGGRAQHRLWKAYLKRFPQGRYADDARAGVCRAATGSGKSTCWERYLQTMPEGAYRDQARAELAAGASQ